MAETITMSHVDLVQKYAQCRNLKQVVDEIEAEHWQESKVICELRVNGMFMTENDEERFASTLIADIQELEVLLRRSDEVYRDSLGSVKKMLPKLQEAALQAADHLREGQEQEAYRKMTQIFESAQWVSEALRLSKQVVSQWVGDETFETRWLAAEVDLNKQLNEVLRAHQLGDRVLLADILEYEFSTNMEVWSNLLQSVES